MLAHEHPFRDGNGRTSRALFYWYMLKSGYDVFKYISISRLLHAAPVKYAASYQYTCLLYTSNLIAMTGIQGIKYHLIDIGKRQLDTRVCQQFTDKATTDITCAKM